MKTRIITGALLGIAMIGSLWVHELAWTWLAALFMVIGLSEFFRIIGISPLSSISWISYVFALVVLFENVPIVVINALALLIGFLYFLRQKHITSVNQLALYVFSFFYVVIGFDLSVHYVEVFGKNFLLYLIVLIWLSDTAAYFVGRFFGKHKMAPVLSPKKTYEGLAGGVVFTILFSYLLTQWIDIDLTVVQSLVMGCFVSLIAPLGDLFESALKRHFNVKDSGSFLPGHGGILDRFDSFLFVMLFFQLVDLFF